MLSCQTRSFAASHSVVQSDQEPAQSVSGGQSPWPAGQAGADGHAAPSTLGAAVALKVVSESVYKAKGSEMAVKADRTWAEYWNSDSFLEINGVSIAEARNVCLQVLPVGCEIENKGGEEGRPRADPAAIFIMMLPPVPY